MYIFCIIMICIASILLILAVLVQSPKSGMAANFGAANQTMGVRQTTDFLEKFTWAMVAAIVFFSLLSTTALPGSITAGEQQDKTTENAEIADDVFGAAEEQTMTNTPDMVMPVGEGAQTITVDGEGKQVIDVTPTTPKSVETPADASVETPADAE